MKSLNPKTQPPLNPKPLNPFLKRAATPSSMENPASAETPGGEGAGAGEALPVFGFGFNLPLVSREWKNGSNSSYNCTPFLPFPTNPR